MIKAKYFYVGIVFLVLEVSFSSACRLLIEDDLSFIFSEVPENYRTGQLLPNFLRFERGHGEQIHFLQAIKDDISPYAWEWEYVSAMINLEMSYIEFYLLKDLSTYRREKWKPSLESDFTVCCSDKNITFTHLLLIKDENLYEPKFNFKTYKGLINHNHVNGFHFSFTSAEGEDFYEDLQKGNYYDDAGDVTVTEPSEDEETSTEPIDRGGEGDGIKILIHDADFNPDNANVVLDCVGEGCEYFNFVVNKNAFDKGYNSSVSVTLNSHLLTTGSIQNGQILTFELIANDGMKTSTAKFSIDVVFEKGVSFPENGEFSPYSFPVVPVAIAAGLASVLLMFTSGSLAYYIWRSKKSKDIVRKLTEAEIREFLEGTPSISADAGRSVDINTPIMALPYNRAFEIPREKLRIDETTILGTGAFGVVWKGSVVFSNGDGITVAVKSIKRNVGVLYFRALLSELKIMAYIGNKHPNIVSLVGACTHNIRKREVYIAVQYCANGNFNSYLKCRRERFTNLVNEGKMELTNAAMQSYMYSNKGVFSKSLSTLDLLRWAIQIANGLQYLDSLGIIHGDLATRNILMDSDRTAKIADFGLSRRLIDYSNYYYTKTTQAPLPWKWMAPESLRDMKFSKKSDIWSFGIVLWEIFTLSCTPYPGLNWDESFVERLENGMRPKKPIYATYHLYEMMCDCWDLEPHDRPAILDLKRSLEDVTNTALRQNHDASYMRFWGEQPFITMLNEDQEGYLLPNDPDRVDYVDT